MGAAALATLRGRYVASRVLPPLAEVYESLIERRPI